MFLTIVITITVGMVLINSCGHGLDSSNSDSGVLLFNADYRVSTYPVIVGAIYKYDLKSNKATAFIINSYAPQLSRDGKKVAYVVRPFDEWDIHEEYAKDPQGTVKKLRRQIFVTNVDGSSKENLTNSVADDVDPCWSPDGKMIAFSSGEQTIENFKFEPLEEGLEPEYQGEIRPINHQIWIMDEDGRNRRQITNLPYQCYNPSFSPDGKRIAFMAEAPVKYTRDWIRWELRGASLLSRPELECPRDFYANVYVVDVDGKNLKKLTFVEKKLDFSKFPKEALDFPEYTLEAAGERYRILDLDNGWDPVWSPTDDLIAYFSNDQIWVMKSDGTGKRQITHFDPDKVWDRPLYPCWSPDGKKIAFTYRKQKKTWKDKFQKRFYPEHERHIYATANIWCINLDGTGLKRLTRGSSLKQCPKYSRESHIMPSWGPSVK